MTMTPPWQLPLMFAGAYLVGSIPFGLIISRLKGTDIRRHGSGNVGATNVGRVLGRRWGLLVLTLDVAKGALATLGTSCALAWSNGGFAPAGGARHDLVLLGAGVCCVLGNVAPFYLRFRGGKGVATSLGTVLGIYPDLTWPGLAALGVWALVVAWSRYVSLGSITAACVLPIAFVLISWLSDEPLGKHYPLLGLCLALSLLVLWRHRGNIGRLLAGTENKIGGADS